jgi:chromosome segregation ATPase
VSPDRNFPTYDRANVPPGLCARCEMYRTELERTQEKNARLREEVRWLQGLPPKNAHQQMEARDRQIRALQSKCASYQGSVAGYVKNAAVLSATIDRVKAERDALRAELEALKAASTKMGGTP